MMHPSFFFFIITLTSSQPAIASPTTLNYLNSSS